MIDDNTIKARLGTVNLGSYELRELSTLCQLFNLPRSTATRLLKVLHVPIVHIGRSSLFNQTAFERIMYVLSRYGGPGFAAPGSDYKLKRKHKTNNTLAEVTTEYLKLAEDRLILLEMATAGGRSRTAARQLADAMRRIEDARATPNDNNNPESAAEE